MARENEIKSILSKLILQNKRLQEIEIEKKRLETERKKVEGQMNWNETRLIEYLRENNLKKLLFDSYSFLIKKQPSKVTKFLKDIADFPDKYKTPQQINKRVILQDYHRKEDLKDLVEITNKDKIFINKLTDATVNYTNEKKGIKRLSKDSDS